MPARSLNSRVFKWPRAEAVDQAVRCWAADITEQRPEIRRIGYFGSYARGDWGVGSDVDLIVIVDHSSQPFDTRMLAWRVSGLPVPSDLLVYTTAEWDSMRQQGKFVDTVEREAVWVFPATETAAGE